LNDVDLDVGHNLVDRGPNPARKPNARRLAMVQPPNCRANRAIAGQL
jgi:hypothetical protein